MANENKRPARRSAKLTALVLMLAVAAGVFFGVRTLFKEDTPEPQLPETGQSYVYEADGIRFAFSLEADGALYGDTFYGAVPAGWQFDADALSAEGTTDRITFLKVDSATGADSITLTVQPRTDSVKALSADNFPPLREGEYIAQGLENAAVEVTDFVSERAMDRDFVRVRYLLHMGESALFCDELYIDDGDRRVLIKMTGAPDGYDSAAFLLFTEGFGFYTENQ